MNSEPTAEITDTSTTQRALRPKVMMPMTVAGIRASRTIRMIKAVDHLSRTWGPAERFSVWFIFYLLPVPPVSGP